MLRHCRASVELRFGGNDGVLLHLIQPTASNIDRTL